MHMPKGDKPGGMGGKRTTKKATKKAKKR